MKLENFERLVHKALTKIPQDLRSYLDNVDIVVEDWPARDQLAGHIVDEDELLLGLYEGVPLTERGEYSMVLPDKITLFQKTIETICADNEVTTARWRQQLTQPSVLSISWTIQRERSGLP